MRREKIKAEELLTLTVMSETEDMRRGGHHDTTTCKSSAAAKVSLPPPPPPPLKTAFKANNKFII